MTKQIPLTQGKFAIVDDEDYEAMLKYKWQLQRVGNDDLRYASTILKWEWNAEKQKPIRRMGYMHRLIMTAPVGMVVDHINGDGLDNWRINLRVCSHQQNLWSMRRRKDSGSGFKGVGFHKQSQKWIARIICNERKYFLGLFANKEDAARAYDIAAVRLYGSFAQLNLPKQFVTWYEAANESTI